MVIIEMVAFMSQFHNVFNWDVLGANFVVSDVQCSLCEQTGSIPFYQFVNTHGIDVHPVFTKTINK